MSRLREVLEAGRFALTGEVGPPKGTDLAAMLAEAGELSRCCLALNVTDNQSAVMRLSGLAAAIALQQAGHEPVFQLTTRDRNRLALQSDLLAAAAFGIENLLALTGDSTTKGDHPEAKPVHDLDSVQLLRAAALLESGRDLAGKKLEGEARPRFLKGCVVSPASPFPEGQLAKLRLKIAAGAEFVQTQGAFDPAPFREFFRTAERHLVGPDGRRVPVMLGVVFLKSVRMARFVTENIPGLAVPPEMMEELAAVPKGGNRAKAVELAARTVGELKGLVQGVHFMPMGWAKLVPQGIAAAGLEATPGGAAGA